MEGLEKEASDIIDSWVEELIGKLLSAGSEGSKRGLWDRFKGGLYNLFLGRTGSLAQKYNPYYSRNKYGDNLGVKEENALTLSDYNTIKTAIVYAESYVNRSLLIMESDSNKLKFVVMIRQAAKELKQKLMPILSKYSATAKNSEDGTSNTSEPAAMKKPEVAGAEETKPDVPPKARSSTPTARSRPAAAKSRPKAKENTDLKKVEATPQAAPVNTVRSFVDVMKDTLTKKTEPNSEWINDGRLVPEQLPAIVAWASKNLGADISDDDKVDEKIKKEFPDFLGIERHEGGNSLLKSFFNKGSAVGIAKKFLGDKAIAKLEVDEKAVISAMGENPKPPSKKDRPSPEGSSGGFLPRVLEDIYGKAKNREEVLESIYDEVISKAKEIVKGNRNKGAFERKWSGYVKNAAFNLEELKEAIKSDLVKTIVSWEFDGVDEKAIRRIISGG